MTNTEPFRDLKTSPDVIRLAVMLSFRVWPGPNQFVHSDFRPVLKVEQTAIPAGSGPLKSMTAQPPGAD